MQKAAPQAYDFGTNWRSFVDEYLDAERVDHAAASLKEFLRLESLAGLSFLDIGCGSGLFSLAAERLGAARVVSVDVDRGSVDCCRELRRREGDPESWTVTAASVLDQDFVEAFGQFDVVYSWGVLHHTGDLWQAVRNAAACVKPGGLLYIAIYNKADGIGLYSDGRFGPSPFWELEKKAYVGLPRWAQRCVDGVVAAGLVASYLVTFKNPVQQMRRHKTLRGMSWMVDIRDWLGGYPYEYASVAEVFGRVRHELGFSLENLTSTNSLRCNEYLFRRPAARNDV
jgi:2-polyprenyl-6-hydroxyphenyl methylase/3-demethylubiquinone-9 3-methyltransferase